MYALGLDETGSPCGARFARYNTAMTSDVLDLGLRFIIFPSSGFAEAAKKLPMGRHYASGKMSVPKIKKALLDELLSILMQPGETSHAYRLEKRPKRVDGTAAQRGESSPKIR